MGTDHRGLDHRLIEFCPGGRAEQNISPEFFGPPFTATLVVDYPHSVAVLMLGEIADFSMIGILPVRTQVGPVNCRSQIRSGIGVPRPRVHEIQRKPGQNHATWLPLTQPLVANTYPLTGVWSEDWSVSLCGRVSTVKIQFTADGMGGAYWHMGPN
jgi:hypothetical protein